jgi:hypothetical protein
MSPPPRFFLAKFILITALILTLALASCGESGGGGTNVGGGDDFVFGQPGSYEVAAVLYRGAPADNNIVGTCPADKVAAAINYVSDNTGTYTLVLEKDINFTSRQYVTGGSTLTIVGKDSERTVTSTTGGVSGIFQINTGVTLTLGENITLKGRSDNNYALIYVYGGTFKMETGSKITDNTNVASGSSGGGINVDSGTFTMTGGTISGNTAGLGGGVCVNDGCTFTMTGGTISGNNTTSGGYGGGVYVDKNGIFNMSDGTISGNNAPNGGGVYISFGSGDTNGTFNMTGGTISGNTASYGGGVYVQGNFSKTGGTIYGKDEGANSNTAGADARGHAAYRVTKYRDATAGTTVNLSSSNDTGWN